MHTLGSKFLSIHVLDFCFLCYTCGGRKDVEEGMLFQEERVLESVDMITLLSSIPVGNGNTHCNANS